MMKRTRKIVNQTQVRTSTMNSRRAKKPVLDGMISLKSLKMAPFLKSKEYKVKCKMNIFFSRRVSVKLEGNESKPANNEDKEKEKKKESNWLKPKTINKKYVFFLTIFFFC